MVRTPLDLSATITGQRELEQKLSQIIQNVKQAQVRQIASDAMVMASEIERRAPRGKTGELEISVEARRKGERYWIVVAGNAKTLNPPKTYNYARAVEFGTVDMAAEPFFFNTYRRLRSWHRREMNKAAKAAIQGSLYLGEVEVS